MAEREKGGGGKGGLLSYFSRKTVTRFSAKAFGEQFQRSLALQCLQNIFVDTFFEFTCMKRETSVTHSQEAGETVHQHKKYLEILPSHVMTFFFLDNYQPAVKLTYYKVLNTQQDICVYELLCLHILYWKNDSCCVQNPTVIYKIYLKFIILSSATIQFLCMQWNRLLSTCIAQSLKTIVFG